MNKANINTAILVTPWVEGSEFQPMNLPLTHQECLVPKRYSMKMAPN